MGVASLIVEGLYVLLYAYVMIGQPASGTISTSPRGIYPMPRSGNAPISGPKREA
jgi:hypothetical protein